jgi:glycosyltransferase involved in cell wall biosynthesis
MRLLYRYRRPIMRIEFFRHYASKIYSTLHVQESFGNWRKLITQEISDYSKSDTFILIDIPTSKRYKKDLVKFLKNTQIRKAAYIHDLIPVDHPEFWSKQEYSRVREDFSEYLVCIEYFDILVANSLYTNRRFQKYFDERAGSNLVEKTRAFKTIYPSSKLVKASLNPAIMKKLVDPQENSFLMVGNFDKRKNFIVALKAFEEIGEQLLLRIVSPSNLYLHSDVQMILNKLKQKENLKIHLFEQVPDRDLSILYSKSKFLLVPSLAEGFGIPVIEGLAHNCNVIVANNSSLSELANKFKLHIAKSNSVTEWASLIKLAISGDLPNRVANFEHRLFMPEQFQRDLLSIVRVDH